MTVRPDWNHLVPLFERVPEAVLLTDGRLNDSGPEILFANEPFSRMTGYSRDEVLGRSARLLQGPASDRAVLASFRRALTRGEAFRGETTGYRKDGAPYVVRWNCVPLRNGSSTPTHWVSFQWDVTAERAGGRTPTPSDFPESGADLQVQALAGFTESLPVSVYCYDATEDLVLYASGAEDDRTPFRTGSSLRFSGVHPEDRDRLRAHFDALRTAATGHWRLVDYRVRAADGGWSWFISRDYVVRAGESGGGLRIVGSVHDITMARQAVRRRVADAVRLRAMLDAVPIGLAILGPDGLVEQANETLCARSGWPHELLLGEPVERLIPDFTPGDHLAIRNLRHRTEGGTIPVEVSISRPTDAEDQARILVVRDRRNELERQAERARMQEQVLQLKKLESVALLTGGVAHDFNSVLMAINGNAALALSEIDDPTIDPREALAQARDALRTIIDHADKASDLSRSLLSYAGKGEAEVAEVDLGVLVSDMNTLLTASVRGGIELRFDLPEGAPQVQADMTQLRQVVLNLVINAADAIGNSAGVVQLTVGAARFAEQDLEFVLSKEPLAPGPYAWIEVADTGSGMDAATRQRIFDPFFTTKDSGHGMGLAAVLGIVRSHGGGIRVESVPGLGTTIRVLFPLACRPENGTDTPRGTDENGSVAGGAVYEIPRPDPATTPSDAPTVLVVDDHATVRSLAGALLEGRGYRVVMAGSGEEALARIQEPGPGGDVAVVLLDSNMPGLDGVTTYRAIRRVAPGLPVVMSTAFGRARDLVPESPGGLVGRLDKPYDRDELFAAIERALERRMHDLPPVR